MPTDWKPIITKNRGGWIPAKFISAGAAGGDPTILKASAGQLGFLCCSNINAAAAYLKLYNKATAPSSSDTPVTIILIPGNTAGGGNSPSIWVGLYFDTGISFRVVTGAADNNNTAVASAEVTASFGYQ